MSSKSRSRTAAAIDQRIYAVVAKIPRGRVATYGWIAERAKLPRGARRVGRALGALPASKRIPWHRVINAQGRISFPEGSAHWSEQRQRLLTEGIVLKNGRVSLKQFGWHESLDELLWRDSFPTS